MESFKQRFKKLIKAFIRIFPYGNDYLLKIEVDSYGIRYRGHFASYLAAKSARRGEVGYDTLNSGKEAKLSSGEEKLDSWFTSQDYPLVYWLNQLIDERSRVLELGGSLGHFYYSTKKYIPGSGSVPWQIAELPEAVRIGLRVALERGENHLDFIDSHDLSVANEADIFLTAGTIQYIEATLDHILQSLESLPTHLLIHNLPVHKTQAFWTLQDLQRCEVPYQIYCTEGLIESMQNLGYELVDDWAHSRTIEIPFHPELSVSQYSGFYFRLRELS